MERLSDFGGLKVAMNSGRIMTLKDIFTFIDPIDWFTKAGLTSYGYALKKMEKPEQLKIEEVYALAEAIGISGLRLLAILSASLPSVQHTQDQQ